MINDIKLEALLHAEGYTNLTEIPERGVCGTMRFIFTTGLVYGIDRAGYKGRYCYNTHDEAFSALQTWDGKEDPTGNWIKHKGCKEYCNPLHK